MDKEEAPKKGGFKFRLTHALRPKSSRGKLTKAPPPGYDYPPLPEKKLAPLEAHRERYQGSNVLVDKTTGERRDDTAMLHALTAHRDSFESIHRTLQETRERRAPGEAGVASLSAELWQIIADYVSPKDAANLALASRTLAWRLGYKAWYALDLPENYAEKIAFLQPMDGNLPNHLFCFPCARYHLRVMKGQESLKPSNVLNPLFVCPQAQNNLNPPPRSRITPGRSLPYTFVQLALRAHHHSPDHGLQINALARRWQQGDWKHQTRFHINSNGHLLMRVISSTFTAAGLTQAGQRLLLYSREDYTPYFSVCAHWKDGELMNLCKCALGHIPTPRWDQGFEGIGNRLQDRARSQRHDPNAIVRMCTECRPMRRCPECPTEYLIEMRLAEDKENNAFKQSIVVTRWSDLGNGSGPIHSREWAAVNGLSDPGAYDSFAMIGKRAVSGIFEAAYTEDHVPGQRILSMNPKNIQKGEEGNSWY